MKRILFLQNTSNSLGGVWSVNKTLGEKFLELGYEVKVISLRNDCKNPPSVDTALNLEVVNEVDLWDITHRRDVLKSIKRIRFFRTLMKYFKEQKRLKRDLKLLKDRINDYDPDYIIASHYHVLLGIPKKYLKKTIHVQHSSFEYAISDSFNVKVLKQYQNKIFGLCWLANTIALEAEKFGFSNNFFIYNPCRFSTSKKASVSKNKKIVVITRISPEKRIDLMIKMINEVFKENDIKDWNFDIYGLGDFSSESLDIISSSKQINYLGKTDKPMDVLLNGSLTLNTSLYEGFSISILEAYTCGIPVISFAYGKSVDEQIVNGHTGYIVDMDDCVAFKKKVLDVIKNPEMLDNLSREAKEFSLKFNIYAIIKQWEKAFNDIDKIN